MTHVHRRARRQGADPALFVVAHLEVAAICREFRRMRRAAGIGQTELAAALGVDVATLPNWENCHKPPLIINLFAWANYFNVQLGIITGDPE